MHSGSLTELRQTENQKVDHVAVQKPVHQYGTVECVSDSEFSIQFDGLKFISKVSPEKIRRLDASITPVSEFGEFSI